MSTQTRPTPTRGRASGREKGRNLFGYLLLTPQMIAFTAIGVVAIGWVIWLSLHHVNVLAGTQEFVGLDNYARILTDPSMITVLPNTFFFVVVLSVAGTVAAHDDEEESVRQDGDHARVRQDTSIVVEPDELLRSGEDIDMVEAEPDHPPDGDHTYCCKRDHLRSEEQVPEKVASFLPPRGATSRRGWSRLGAHADNTGSIAEHTFGSASSRSESGVYTNSSSEESRALATLAPFGATGKI